MAQSQKGILTEHYGESKPINLLIGNSYMISNWETSKIRRSQGNVINGRCSNHKAYSFFLWIFISQKHKNRNHYLLHSTYSPFDLIHTLSRLSYLYEIAGRQ